MSVDDSKEQIPLFEIAAVAHKKEPVKKEKPVPETEKDEVDRKRKRAAKAAPVEKDAGGARKKQAVAQKYGAKIPLSGQVPEGDVRLTANIREDLHLKLKIAAARRRTTIGELLEELVEKYI